VVLALALGVQLILPYSDVQVDVGGLAPRRPRLVTAPLLPEYPAILRVPLFTPDRHPGDIGAGPASASDTLAGYAVLGAAVSRSAATAVVSAPGVAPKTVKAGDLLEGWRVVSVGRSRVTFERKGERRDLAVGVVPDAQGQAGAGGQTPQANDQ
jgi:hypothetical protein